MFPPPLGGHEYVSHGNGSVTGTSGVKRDRGPSHSRDTTPSDEILLFIKVMESSVTLMKLVSLSIVTTSST